MKLPIYILESESLSSLTHKNSYDFFYKFAQPRQQSDRLAARVRRRQKPGRESVVEV